MSQADLAYQLEPGEIYRRLGRIANSKYPLVAYRQGADMAAVPFAQRLASDRRALAVDPTASGAA